MYFDSADIDECSVNASVCGMNSTCVNTTGGYECLCDKGYEVYQNVCTGECFLCIQCTYVVFRVHESLTNECGGEYLDRTNKCNAPVLLLQCSHCLIGFFQMLVDPIAHGYV